MSTPTTIDNRPGLAAIAYRVGTHPQFKQTMLARLSRGGLTTRADGDFSIALLDAWSTVADILTFYQERIANESYLVTATERRSLVELARLDRIHPPSGRGRHDPSGIHPRRRTRPARAGSQPVTIDVGVGCRAFPERVKNPRRSRPSSRSRRGSNGMPFDRGARYPNGFRHWVRTRTASSISKGSPPVSSPGTACSSYPTPTTSLSSLASRRRRSSRPRTHAGRCVCPPTSYPRPPARSRPRRPAPVRRDQVDRAINEAHSGVAFPKGTAPQRPDCAVFRQTNRGGGLHRLYRAQPPGASGLQNLKPSTHRRPASSRFAFGRRSSATTRRNGTRCRTTSEDGTPTRMSPPERLAGARGVAEHARSRTRLQRNPQ